jgi:hypothetical protein
MQMGISNINSNNNSASLLSSLLSETSNSMPTLFDVLDGNDNTNLSGSTSSSGDISDILDLSPQSQAAADNLTNLTDNNLASLLSSLSGNNTSDGIQSTADQLRSSIQSELSKLFKDNGIDTSKEIDLQVDANGQVIVANDNPQKAQIEQLFKDDPKLRDAYVQFTAASELAAAAQETSAFQAAYATDPTTAVSQYSYLFDSNNKPTLSLSILGDKYQALLERSGQEALVVSTSE